MQLLSVDCRNGLTPDAFRNQYLRPLKPVVITDLTASWPAREKWTIDHFKKNYGHLIVPVVSPRYSKPGKGYMSPEKYISFQEYLELLEQGPTEYRLFLFNIFKHAPELCNDFDYPDLMGGFIKDFPFMFFGGQGAVTPLHFDIDRSHVFLNQIHGRKRVVLFAPDQSRLLYHHPFTVASYIDVNHPDEKNYPALQLVKGYEVILQPGESLFIPSCYWHYIEYTDGGYSISLRANESYIHRALGAFNIARHYVVDKSMNKMTGSYWRAMKDNMARKRAVRALEDALAND